jgi:hypothetical protein
MDENIITFALGIFLAALLTMTIGNACTSDASEDVPPYRKSVNCAEKKQGSRPACWNENDWQAYCQNTGNCRNNRR